MLPIKQARALLAIVAIAPVAIGAQQTDSLRRVIITATRVDTTLGRNIGASSVIDRAAIERSGARDVAELLRLVPGISIARSGGPGAQSSLFLRGGESDYVRVLIDGVQVNDPGGAIDLAWLSVDDVERIEVVRGPASVLYGTDAVTASSSCSPARHRPNGCRRNRGWQLRSSHRSRQRGRWIEQVELHRWCGE
jgi:vitamin B12 transporter